MNNGQDSSQLQARSSQVRILMRSLYFINLPNLYSYIMALEFTQLLTEMSTRNLPGHKAWTVHKADNLTAICEQTV
jgi:hypothetical protein